tara:strand:+ start:5313 stop:5471 length:159 start_codon:yes stop_codon:yes gene_type:complete
MNVADLIDNLQSDDNVSANNTFNSIIADKLQVAIDSKKIEVASSLNTRQEQE